MKRIAILLTAALLLTACDGSVYYDHSQAVDEHGWRPDDKLAFDVEVDDTTHLFNFLVEVRNSVTYPYSNTFLFINTSYFLLANLSILFNNAILFA